MAGVARAPPQSARVGGWCCSLGDLWQCDIFPHSASAPVTSRNWAGVGETGVGIGKGAGGRESVPISPPRPSHRSERTAWAIPHPPLLCPTSPTHFNQVSHSAPAVWLLFQYSLLIPQSIVLGKNVIAGCIEHVSRAPPLSSPRSGARLARLGQAALLKTNLPGSSRRETRRVTELGLSVLSGSGLLSSIGLGLFDDQF